MVNSMVAASVSGEVTGFRAMKLPSSQHVHHCTHPPRGRRDGRFSRLSIAFTHHNVVGSKNGDYIRDHVSAGHMIERAHMYERRGANLEPVRLAFAGTDNVEAQLALGRFRPAID